MFDTLRNKLMTAAAMSAGTVTIATLLAAGQAAADPKQTAVKIQSQLPATAEVKFTGITVTGGEYQITSGGDARPLGNAPDGTTIKWVAKPKYPDDKSKFTQCKGDQKVTGLTSTIVLTAEHCEHDAAAAGAAAKSGSGSSAAAKPAESSAPAEKSGARATKKWTVNLVGPEQISLDGKPWTVELFDAVACKALDSVSIAKKNEKKAATVIAREGAGQATAKGELGAHLRWKTSGVGPGQQKMYFWGDSKPVKDGATVTIVIDTHIAENSTHDITKDCDK